VVLQKSSKKALVGGKSRDSLIVNFPKSRVGGCDDGDAGETSQSFEYAGRNDRLKD
jgi:hypothetical protein